MAYSRSRRGAGKASVLLLALVLALALGLGGVRPAYAASSLAERVVEPVEVVSVSASALGVSANADVAKAEGADGVEDVSYGGSSSLDVTRLVPMALSAECNPAGIDAGDDCGMDWMCGIEPCLCGSSDAWGGCSCDGYVHITPDVSFSSSDESVVRVVQWNGSWWLVPVGSGQATITCTASLKYYDTTQASVSVNVPAEVTSADVTFVLGAAAVVLVTVAVVLVVVWAVRKLIKVRRGKADVLSKNA